MAPWRRRTDGDDDEDHQDRKLSTRARALLEQLKRRDLDYGAVELATYRELRTAGLATVIFSARWRDGHRAARRRRARS